ncbi:hypothetical protein LX16_1721 [Stackebrandtia albiflava]|uniref:Uncharacterized protein n=1 Tax=Stackebrandtia albiflava TaxID=406432 RepID=A0A562VDW1_9ACTN|nr:hypothetical protein LX16_1721 [Stackebrandtia albiflava]
MDVLPEGNRLVSDTVRRERPVTGRRREGMVRVNGFDTGRAIHHAVGLVVRSCLACRHRWPCPSYRVEKRRFADRRCDDRGLFGLDWDEGAR